MKQKLLLTGLGLLMLTAVDAQTSSSTLEDVNLAQPDTFYNGSDGAGGFQSGNIYYTSIYDSTWGYWAGGFAASNKTDTATSGYTNLYSAKAGLGCLQSATYAVGQNYSTIILTGQSAGDSIFGFYVCNTTYAYNSMRDGDAFAKKFGGVSGNDPDWFLLTVKKYSGGALVPNDSVYFYLADYRFLNNSNDYILNDWQWVNCKSLGTADSLQFILTSSDTGQFGMNTPAFFAIDNVTSKASIVGISDVKEKNDVVSVFPNPFNDQFAVAVNINEGGIVYLFDAAGKLLKSKALSAAGNLIIDSSDLSPGTYILQIVTAHMVITEKLIRQ